jgi:uncharacterized integral membrane protein
VSEQPTSASRLALLIAPHGPAGGIADVLQDLSAVGLIEPLLWVEAEEIPSSGRDVALQQQSQPLPGWLIAEGRRRRFDSLTEYLSRLETAAPDHYLVGALWVTAEGSGDLPETSARHLVGQLQRAAPTAAIDQIRVIVADPVSAHQASPRPEAGHSVTWNEWSNLLIEPADAAGPGQNVVAAEWTAPDDAAVIGRRATPVLASVFGLWRGCQPAPPPDGNLLCFTRSFHRRIDATALETTLRAQALKTSDLLPAPQPIRPGDQYFDDPGAVAALAGQLLGEPAYHSLFQGDELEGFPVDTVRFISAWERVKLFASFWWKALLSLPGSLLQNLQRGVYGAAARRVRNALGSSGSPDEHWHVRGILDDGTPLTWQERALQIADANPAAATAAAADPGERLRQAETPAGLWQDIESAVLTLADGQDRRFAAPGEGNRKSYVADPKAIAPAPETAFRVPAPWNRPLSQGGIGVAQIGPANSLDALDASWRLRELAKDRGGSEAARVADDIDKWWEGQKLSLVGRLADQLRQRFLALEQDYDNVGTGIAVTNPQFGRSDKRCARALRWLAVTAGLLLFGLLQATRGPQALALIPWPWPAPLSVITALEAIGGLLLTYLATSFLVFTRLQQLLFQALHQVHRRKKIESVLARRRAQINREMQLVSDAYDRLTCWALVWGELLARPFGHDLGPISGFPAVPAEGLPAAVKFAAATVSEEAVARAVAPIREHLFQVGWLSGPVETLRSELSFYILNRGPRLLEESQAARFRVGPAALTGRLGVEDSSLLQRGDQVFYGLRCDDQPTRSALPRWAGSVVFWGVPPGGAAAFWQRCFESIEAAPSSTPFGPSENRRNGPLMVGEATRNQVLGQVRSDDGQMAVGQFLAGLEPNLTVTGRRVNFSLLQPAAVDLAYEPASVVQSPTGLSFQVTLTQFSTGIKGSDTRLVALHDASRPPGPASDSGYERNETDDPGAGTW